MRVDRRVFLLTAAAAACSWKRERSSLTRAAQYLWAQQAADGGFHSATYGLLRSGQSLTPFVLGALLRVPDATVAVPAGAVDRAIAFIKKHTNLTRTAKQNRSVFRAKKRRCLIRPANG